MGFLEPYVLSPVLWELVHDRKRTWGSNNPTFSLLSLLFYGSRYATGREHGVLRTPHSLSSPYDIFDALAEMGHG